MSLSVIIFFFNEDPQISSLIKMDWWDFWWGRVSKAICCEDYDGKWAMLDLLVTKGFGSVVSMENDHL